VVSSIVPVPVNVMSKGHGPGAVPQLHERPVDEISPKSLENGHVVIVDGYAVAVCTALRTPA
jgi:hypothetical protein